MEAIPRWMRLHPCCPGVLFAGEDAQFLCNRQATSPYEKQAWLGIHTYTYTVLAVSCHLSPVLKDKEVFLGSEGAPCTGAGTHGNTDPGGGTTHTHSGECFQEARRVRNWATRRKPPEPC